MGVPGLRIRRSRVLRLLAALLLVPPALSGCSLASMPSQQHPNCSWNNTPPANNARICDEVFATLTAITRALQRGDDTAVHRVVTTPQVAARVINYGRSKRADGLSNLHIVPSLTLQDRGGGRYGAGFYVDGKTRGGHIADPETLYLEVRHGRATVYEDQPNQLW